MSDKERQKLLDYMDSKAKFEIDKIAMGNTTVLQLRAKYILEPFTDEEIKWIFDGFNNK